jgi:hypothetical protein
MSRFDALDSFDRPQLRNADKLFQLQQASATVIPVEIRVPAVVRVRTDMHVGIPSDDLFFPGPRPRLTHRI